MFSGRRSFEGRAVYRENSIRAQIGLVFTNKAKDARQYCKRSVDPSDTHVRRAAFTALKP